MSKAPSPILYQNKLFVCSLSPAASLNYSLYLKKPLLSLSFFSSYSSLQLPPFSWQRYNQQHRCHQFTRVSTAPVEYATPTPDFDFRSEIARLRALRSKLAVSGDLREKNSVIDADSRVRRFFGDNRGFAKVLASVDLNLREMFLVKCLVAAGQEHALCLGHWEEFEEAEEHSLRSSMKSALYALAEMIERVDVNNNGGEGLGRPSGSVLGDEEVGELREFLKFLEEIEQFYSCIGGIIG